MSVAKFDGIDTEIKRELNRYYPGLSITKKCGCCDGGITVRTEVMRYHDIVFPKSVTVTCSLCETPYLHKLDER